MQLIKNEGASCFWIIVCIYTISGRRDVNIQNTSKSYVYKYGWIFSWRSLL